MQQGSALLIQDLMIDDEPSFSAWIEAGVNPKMPAG
jgi:hypothetical protein